MGAVPRIIPEAHLGYCGWRKLHWSPKCPRPSLQFQRRDRAVGNLFYSVCIVLLGLSSIALVAMVMFVE